jgi:uncharacterized protein YgbK (DUF1537 family)
MVGCHLLKAVEGWTDLGFADFELRYLRDKAKREVDFVVVRDRRPWFLVEVKRGDTTLSPALAHFQAQTCAAHAFQAVMDLPFQPVDAFAQAHPCVVPARTLLSQLLCEGLVPRASCRTGRDGGGRGARREWTGPAERGLEPVS